MKKVVVSLFIVLLLSGCFKQNKEVNVENIKVNNKVEKIEDKGISLELDEFYYKDGYSTINLSITNNNDYIVYIGSYKVYIYDDKDNLIGMFNPKFESNINNGDTMKQMFSTQVDFSRASKVEYEFNDIEKVEF